MRAFLAWTVAAAVSVLLGVALYSTSLQGSTTGYQEAVMSPQPVPTVVKTKTKIVRKPARTKVVYVPQPVAQPVTPNRVQQPATTTQQRATQSIPVASDSDHSSSEERESEERERDDD